MESTGTRRTPRVGMWLIGLGAAVTMFGAIGGTNAGAETNPITVLGDNVTTCTQIGFGSSTQYNGSTTTSVTDTAYFTATVVNDRYVTITNIAPGVVIQAAAIKSGNNYNVYNPILPDMTSPLNGGGQIGALSHWFLCYTYTPVVTTTTAAATTTTTELVTTTTAAATTTTTELVTTTTAAATTTTEAATTTTEVGNEGPTTTTTEPATTTTEVGSEGPTTTTTDPGTTTTDVASEGPTTTLVAGELPRTGSDDPSSGMVLLGILLVIAGGAMTAMSRRPHRS